MAPPLPAAVIFEAMNSRDLSLLDPHLSDDVRFDFPGSGVITGKKRVLVFLKALLRKYPDIAFSIQDVITGDDKFCVVWTNTARLDTPRPYRNSGITLVRCAGNRITFISDYFKDTSFVNPSGFAAPQSP